jgi:hypothetical protein
VDQYARIVLGLALAVYAFQDGRSIQGSQWVGLAGFVLLATALFRSCPVYSVLGMQSINAGSSEPDLEYRALLTIKEIIAPPETDRASRGSVLPPSVDQSRGVVDHSVAVFEEPFRIAADEVQLMLGTHLVHRPEILDGVCFRQLGSKFVEDSRLRNRAFEKFISGKHNLVQQHVP